MGSVLHASYSGWFPFCISEYQPLPGELYSVVGLSTAMNVFWKIKKFRMYGTYKLVGPPEETRNWEMVVERNAESEAELTCNKLPYWNIVSSVNVINPDFSFGSNPVLSKDGGFWIDSAFNGFFSGGGQEQGFYFATSYGPSLLDTYIFEGVTYYKFAENNEGERTINHEILERWDYV